MPDKSLDLLADRLSRGLRPVRQRRVGHDAMLIGAVCVTELALYLAAGAMRPDMDAAMPLPSFWWKLVSMGLIVAVSGAVALLSFDPVGSPRRGLRLLAGVAACCVLAGWLVDAGQGAHPALATRLRWRDGLDCVAQMALLSIPAAVGLGVLMRRGAPADLGRSALAAGLAAGCWGAFVFVFACPFDDPLYIAVWYAAACALVTLATRLLLPRLTRW